jgi:thymidylate kinase
MRLPSGSVTIALRTRKASVPEAVTRGRLIAIDGAHGDDVFDAATTLVESLADRSLSAGISRWDASGLFTDVLSAPPTDRDLSPRTLLLLYAADLAFRVRWEIGPALQQGAVVVAAPYVATAMTFGTAAGLSREWLSTLLRFAPLPSRTVILKDKKPQRVWKRRPERGFTECCTTLLEATPEGFARRRTRTAMIGALATDAEGHGGLVKPKHVRDLVEQILKPRRARLPRPEPRRRSRR